MENPVINWFQDKNLFADRDLTTVSNPVLTEPFHVFRSAPRMLFDFAVLTSCITPNHPELPVLDFGAGTGWLTEFIARMGRQVVAFDIHGDLEPCLRNRINTDQRIPGYNIGFTCGDGHNMPFEDSLFSNILCFDTLHHMYDYPKVFKEFSRILAPGGRAIFVEPGAKHSQSPETIAFLKEQKAHDPTWIERDVVLEEINTISRSVGMTGLTIVPVPHPDAFIKFNLDNWQQFRNSRCELRQTFCDQLSDLNYNGRVIFYVDRLD